jgi:predicted house-cleaning noncanonical NTP pyrophosphatase (MazG superfamily)
LAAWLLPPHGPNHQLYTHKGWDYGYSLEDDKDYWSALEIKQSWEVKKYLLTKAVEKIYAVSESKARAISVLLYNIHRLRDIQYNSYDETTAMRKKYLFNACDEIIQYVLPLTGDKELRTRVNELISNVKETESKLTGPTNDDLWQGLNEPIDKLLGSIDNSEIGLVSQLVTELCS